MYLHLMRFSLTLYIRTSGRVGYLLCERLLRPLHLQFAEGISTRSNYRGPITVICDSNNEFCSRSARSAGTKPTLKLIWVDLAYLYGLTISLVDDIGSAGGALGHTLRYQLHSIRFHIAVPTNW